MPVTSPDSVFKVLADRFYEKIKGETPTVYDPNYWQGRLLEYSMRDEKFRTNLFRFVDLLPALKTGSQISRHVNEYFAGNGNSKSGAIDLLLKAATFGPFSGFGSIAVRKGVTQLAERFIIGKDIESALKTAAKLHDEDFALTIDQLGEATLSYPEAKNYQKAYINLIKQFGDRTAKWHDNPIITNNHFGAIPVGNISLKLSGIEPNLDSVDPVGSVDRLKKALLPILMIAKEKNVFVNLDMEQWEYHGITYDLFEEITATPELRGWPHLGVVAQAYLKNSEQDLKRLISLAKNRGAPVTVRLVKGAYWDYEVINARAKGFDCPVYTEKVETDYNFEKLTELLFENIDHMHPAIASHNHRSVLNAIATAESKGIPNNSFEIQMLYGMAEPERKAIRDLGHRIRLYAPVGELLPGIGYLVRRLLENTSNTSFLRMSYHEGFDKGELLKKPVPAEQPEETIKMISGDLDTAFQNVPNTDFTERAAYKTYKDSMENIKAEFPIKAPVAVNNVERWKGETFRRFDPGSNDLLVGETVIPTLEDVEKAVLSANNAMPEWSGMDVVDRAVYIEKLGEIIENHRSRLAALEAYEVGKTWREADADISEAVDFCHYYARRAVMELSAGPQSDIAGEENELRYKGRGPTAVIAPWNFPLAILCGMTTAALVAGNSVIMKPSGNSSLVGYELYKMLKEVGLPMGVVHFIPGAGRLVGERLAQHPLIAQIAFTGSKEVGLGIIEKAAKVAPGQPQIKRVICEMGGKNGIIIDDDADLDEAVSGVLKSAFGYAGQKCSACSRVIVVGEDTYDSVVERLKNACDGIIIAPACNPETQLGPVVDAEVYKRLLDVINSPGAGAEAIYIGDKSKAPSSGYYVPPAVFAVTDEQHPLMQKEFFGPIVAVMKVNSFDEALKVATSTEYALTGGLFSRSPVNIEKARKSYVVGNLYINRGITGALVHRQPFGGFGMSGIGTKAGGPGYLLNFAEPQSISENSMRRGFAPDE